MSKIEAWQCDRTGKKFFDLDSYSSHLKAHAKSKNRQIKLRAFERDIFQSFFSLTKPEDIKEFIVEHLELLSVRSAIAQFRTLDRKGFAFDERAELGRKFVAPNKVYLRIEKVIQNIENCRDPYLSLEITFRYEHKVNEDVSTNLVPRLTNMFSGGSRSLNPQSFGIYEMALSDSDQTTSTYVCGNLIFMQKDWPELFDGYSPPSEESDKVQTEQDKDKLIDGNNQHESLSFTL